jgi:hypothetical protein
MARTQSALLVSPELAKAQFTQQGPKLVGSDAVGPAAAQGYSVALSGDGNTAIVGGVNDNAGIGAAWVFIRNNGVWSQQGSKLVGSDAISLRRPREFDRLHAMFARRKNPIYHRPSATLFLQLTAN